MRVSTKRAKRSLVVSDFFIIFSENVGINVIGLLVNNWMFRFVRDCVGEVAAKVLTASVPPYSTILDLDAKIRDFTIPAFPDNIPLDPSRPATIMARYVLAHSRETSELFFSFSDLLCVY